MENSEIKLTKSQEQRLNSAKSAEEIRSLMHEFGEQAGVLTFDPETRTHRLAERDAEGKFVSQQTEQKTEERTFEKEIIVNGRTITIVASSAAALSQREADALEVAEALTPDEPAFDAAAYTRAARSSLTPMQKAELELQFKRGDIDAETYLARSGAVDNYLASRGIDIPSLQQATVRAETSSWSEATERFKQNEGRDWLGGDSNLKTISTVLQALGLTEAQDKQAALSQAWEYMKQNDMVFAPEVPAIPDNATPQMILEMFKAGQTPDEANQRFMQAHSSTGSGSSLFSKR